MYSSVLSSQQNSRLSQLNSTGYPTHPSQFSVRVFKNPTVGSYYTAPKYDLGYHPGTASDYYPTSRYEDTTPRFAATSEAQRKSQYPTLRTNPTSRDYESRPPNVQSNYSIHRGNAKDTYIYEQSDAAYSTSEFDDTTTNGSYSPALSTDSLITLKSPLPSPLTEQGSVPSTRRNSMSVPVPPLPVGSGTDLAQGHSNTSIQLPSSTVVPAHTTDSRPPSNYPPPPLLPPAPTPSSGYTWHHAIPTIPPSEADTEDISLEARLNAEYNAISSASYYTPNPNNADTTRVVPVPPGRDRNTTQYTTPITGRPIPNAIVEATPDDLTSARDPLPVVPRSPTGSTSTIVETLEEGRAASYTHRRDSRVPAEAEQFLPPFPNEDRLNSRDRRNSVSYQRIPPSTSEMRREYSTSTTSRSVVSSANATYQSSPPRVPAYPTDTGGDRPPTVPPPSSRPRTDSRAGYSARPELARRSPETRDGPPLRSSPPRQEEVELNTSPRRRQENSLNTQTTEPGPPPNRPISIYATPSARPEVQPPSRPPEPPTSRAADNYEVPVPSGSRNERRTSPPIAAPGNLYRIQGTTPAEPYRPAFPSEASRSFAPPPVNGPYRPQSTAPAENLYRSQVVTPPTDPYRPPSDPYRPQSGVSSTIPYYSQSAAPPPSGYRPTGASEAHRVQSTAPPEIPYRSQGTVVATSENPYRSSNSTRQTPPHADSGYPQQAAVPPASYQPQPEIRPTTRPRTNSGTWSRNATANTAVVSTKPPSPPSRHVQPPAPRPGSRPSSPISEVPRGLGPTRDTDIRREQRPPQAIYAAPQPQPASQVTRNSESQRDPRGPPPSYSATITSSPDEIYTKLRDTYTSPRDGRGSPKRTGDSEKPPKAKATLTIRNPSPPAFGTEAIETPRVHQPFPESKRRHPDGERLTKAPYNSTTTSGNRRATLPHDRASGQINGLSVQIPHPLPEQPQRRFSDGDQVEGPTFSINTGRASAPLTRCVRWNENLICPSPVFPSRRKGWFNRRGDQLWTNEGAFKPPSHGQEYPPDLDDYPECGQGWMNEEGIRIDLEHRLIPKVPLRSALKQPKPLS